MQLEVMRRDGQGRTPGAAFVPEFLTPDSRDRLCSYSTNVSDMMEARAASGDQVLLCYLALDPYLQSQADAYCRPSSIFFQRPCLGCEASVSHLGVGNSRDP